MMKVQTVFLLSRRSSCRPHPAAPLVMPPRWRHCCAGPAGAVLQCCSSSIQAEQKSAGLATFTCSATERAAVRLPGRLSKVHHG